MINQYDWNFIENINNILLSRACAQIANTLGYRHRLDIDLTRQCRFDVDNPGSFEDWSVPPALCTHDDVMKTFSALLAICVGNSPVPGEFPAQRPVTRSVDVFFDLLLNKRLSKQSWGWWFETPWHPLWRHHNAKGMNGSELWQSFSLLCAYNFSLLVKSCFASYQFVFLVINTT